MADLFDFAPGPDDRVAARSAAFDEEQPWRNGRVGAMGSSYVGETTGKLAAEGHPTARSASRR